MGNTLTIMVGLPGSGKSKEAERLQKEDIQNGNECVIINSGLIRKVLYGNTDVECSNKPVFIICHITIIENLLKGKNVIFDATNLSYKNRHTLISEVKESVPDTIFKCCLVIGSIDSCIESYAKKKNYNDIKEIEEKIIDMARGFNVPFKEEGFSEICLLSKDKSIEELSDDNLIRGVKVFDKEYFCNLKNKGKKINNTIMFMMIEGHSYNTFENLKKNTNKIELLAASLVHDLGKLFSYKKNKDGSINHNGHAELFAYMLLDVTENELYVPDDIIDGMFKAKDYFLDIVFYINYHMLPHKWMKSKKRRLADAEIFGENKVANLLLFHEANQQGK